MRKFALLAVAALTVAVAVPAWADMKFGKTTQFVKAKSPKKAGTKSKPRSSSLFLHVGAFNDDKTQTPVVEKAVISLPKEFEFNLKAFPSCSKATLDNGQTQAVKSCTKKDADIGTGSAKGQLGLAALEFKVFAFNGGGGNKIELYLEGDPLNKAVEGTLSGKKGKAKTLTILVPGEIQQAVPNSFASLTELMATINKKSVRKSGKTTNLFETTGCPSNKKWRIKGDFFINQDAPASAGAPEKIFDQVDVPCTP